MPQWLRHILPGWIDKSPHIPLGEIVIPSAFFCCHCTLIVGPVPQVSAPFGAVIWAWSQRFLTQVSVKNRREPGAPSRQENPVTGNLVPTIAKNVNVRPPARLQFFI